MPMTIRGGICMSLRDWVIAVCSSEEGTEFWGARGDWMEGLFWWKFLGRLIPRGFS